ncbi:MAG: M23 family metallopeptidase, partial [Pseudomonadales bacterium]
SSNFNPRRRHPIHKSIRAHRGIDYAAPRGTPVFAAGDGRVTKSGYSRANGNFIVVSHGPQYTTKYLHLTKRHVKRLSKVKKGQVIGTVGSTGYATGPHLHYEFLVNGVHRNPRTILNKLPKAKSIADAEMQRFKQSIASLEVKLAKHQQAYQLAQLNTGAYTLVEPRSADAGH